MIHNVLSMGQDEKQQQLDTRDYETEKFLPIMTEKGTVKKSAFKDLTQTINCKHKTQRRRQSSICKTTSGKEDVILFLKRPSYKV